MKKRILTLLIFSALATVTLYSCKKDKKGTLDDKFKQFNSDANYYKSESDQANNDINNELSQIGSMGGRMEETYSSPLCGATIDTTGAAASKTVVFNFDGVTPCFSPSRTRSGQIKVQLTSGAKWSDKGAVLTITFIDYKITRLSDNKSIKFNGVKTLANLEGNDWLGFFTGTKKLRYKEKALNINVSFDDGSSSVWNTVRTTEWSFTFDTKTVNFSGTGDTTINGINAVDSWGTNRYGEAFVTYCNAPVVSNTYCGLWRFISGEIVHHVNSTDFKLNLGVDQNGKPTPYTCAYGFKVTWKDMNGKEQEVVLSY